MNDIISSIKNGCIVSCQAYENEPLFGAVYMTAMAVAAKESGAVAIRANTPIDISAIKKVVSLPIIGLHKVRYSNSNVYITPTIKEVSAVIRSGADIVAIDATNQPRPDGIPLKQLVANIREMFSNVLILADISTFEEGVNAIELGADLVSTTLSGYTSYSTKSDGPDFKLIERLAKLNAKPIIAEGRIWSIEDCIQCFHSGAYSVVIGAAITRPQDITKRFVEAIRNDIMSNNSKRGLSIG